MKVLCINTNGFRNDGISNSILGYFNHMDLSDMHVDVLKTRDMDSAIEERITSIGLNIQFTDYRKNVLSYILKTAQFIRKQKYDIVHVHGSSAILAIDLLAAWIGGVKVRIAHSRNTTCNHPAIDKLLRSIFNKLCNVRFACGEDAGKWLFGNRKFTVIRNAKNLKQFSYNPTTREQIRQQYGWQHNIVIGHVGNFNYQKNQEFLIDVFAKLVKNNPAYRLVLMGVGGEYMTKAKEQVFSLGVSEQVTFMGSINNVSDILQAMDLMLFPSRFEGLPNVVLEWQLSGVPSFISNRITKECKFSDLVNYLSIDEGIDIWVNAVENFQARPDRQKDADAVYYTMNEAGFDIVDAACNLKKMYLELIEEL